jgi:uncharacterized membrane protein YeaQ/YmgE (transglycosylase-associated protein family)
VLWLIMGVLGGVAAYAFALKGRPGGVLVPCLVGGAGGLLGGLMGEMLNLLPPGVLAFAVGGIIVPLLLYGFAIRRHRVA